MLSYVHLKKRRTFLPQIIDDFPAVYEKLSANFLVSRVKVIDAVGFLSFFFLSCTRTTIKFLVSIWLRLRLILVNITHSVAL